MSDGAEVAAHISLGGLGAGRKKRIKPRRPGHEFGERARSGVVECGRQPGLYHTSQCLVMSGLFTANVNVSVGAFSRVNLDPRGAVTAHNLLSAAPVSWGEGVQEGRPRTSQCGPETTRAPLARYSPASTLRPAAAFSQRRAKAETTIYRFTTERAGSNACRTPDLSKANWAGADDSVSGSGDSSDAPVHLVEFQAIYSDAASGI